MILLRDNTDGSGFSFFSLLVKVKNQQNIVFRITQGEASGFSNNHQRHYIIPHWVQIIKLYQTVFPGFDVPSQDRVIEKMQENGYGIPPEIYTDSGIFFETA